MDLGLSYLSTAAKQGVNLLEALRQLFNEGPWVSAAPGAGPGIIGPQVHPWHRVLEHLAWCPRRAHLNSYPCSSTTTSAVAPEPSGHGQFLCLDCLPSAEARPDYRASRRLCVRWFSISWYGSAARLHGRRPLGIRRRWRDGRTFRSESVFALTPADPMSTLSTLHRRCDAPWVPVGGLGVEGSRLESVVGCGPPVPSVRFVTRLPAGRMVRRHRDRPARRDR